MIEQGVPIPEKHADTLRKMKDGDSVFFSEKSKAYSFRATAQTLLKRGKLPGQAVFVLRAVEGGWRVWRVSHPEPKIAISDSESDWLDSALAMDMKESEAA